LFSNHPRLIRLSEDFDEFIELLLPFVLDGREKISRLFSDAGSRRFVCQHIRQVPLHRSVVLARESHHELGDRQHEATNVVVSATFALHQLNERRLAQRRTDAFPVFTREVAVVADDVLVTPGPKPVPEEENFHFRNSTRMCSARTLEPAMVSDHVELAEDLEVFRVHGRVQIDEHLDAGEEIGFHLAHVDALIRIRIGAERPIALLDRFEEHCNVLREPLLHLTEELTFARGVATQIFGVDVGRTTQLHERVERPRPGLHFTSGFGLGGDGFDLLGHGGDVFEQGDGVAVALAHLVRAVDARHPQGVADVHLWDRENFPGERVVEATGEIPSHLDVLGLILSHGDTVSADTENVRSHQYRVAEQTVTDLAFGNTLVVDAVLKRGAGLQPAELDDITQEDSDLTDFRDVALPVEGGFGGVDATGEVVFGDLDRQ